MLQIGGVSIYRNVFTYRTKAWYCEVDVIPHTSEASHRIPTGLSCLMVQGVKDLTPSICQAKQEDIKSKCHQQLSFELSPLNLPTAETETKSRLTLPNFSHLFVGGINFHSQWHSIQNNFCPWRLWMTRWRRARHQRFMLGQRQWLVSQLSGRDSRGS